MSASIRVGNICCFGDRKDNIKQSKNSNKEIRFQYVYWRIIEQVELWKII